MNYEKMYKDALERARSLHEQGMMPERIEYIFPQLAESENERIKMFILTSLNYLIGIENSPGSDYDKQLKEAYSWLEKQKEQKPAERLEAERDNWYVCIKDYYRGGKKNCSVGDLVQAKGGMYMMGEEDISEWFRRAYYEEVKDAFGPNADTNIPEQTAEWSEEDEKFIKELCNLLASIAKNNYVGRYYVPDLVNKLQSLHPQPHWKPSEEQMEMLQDAIAYYGDSWVSHKQQLLESLYNDLKKL